MKLKKHVLLALFVGFSILGFVIPVKANLTKEVKPYEDSYVRAYAPDDNFGSSDYLQLGADLWGEQEETVLKFLIPTVETEIIRVYIVTYWYSFTVETPLSVSACIISNSWNEYTITWNNKPSRGTLLATDSTLTDGDYFVIDVSLTHVTQGSTFSVCIYENAPFNPDGLQGGSREGGYKVPVLKVQYETPPIMVLVPVIGVVVTIGAVVGILYAKKKKRRQVFESPAPATNLACPKCGTVQRLNGSTFCIECGHKLN